jgi:hypothetical protein
MTNKFLIPSPLGGEDQGEGATEYESKENKKEMTDYECRMTDKIKGK